jgi:hypothetical protein
MVAATVPTMGNWFQWIADIEVTEVEATEAAAAVTSWLSELGVIEAEPTNCVFGSDLGHAPGPRYTLALEEPDLHPNPQYFDGVEIETGPTVFHPIQSWGVSSPICPHCSRTTDFNDPLNGEATWDSFTNALTDWHGGGSGETNCPGCGEPVRINDWQWTGEYPIVAGFLGLTFWNWPPLSDAFVAQVANRLGHRVVFSPADKL